MYYVTLNTSNHHQSLHYFIQIHHATGDPSESAVIESFLKAYCDAASTELEASETDFISEAAAVNDVYGNEQLLPSSPTINSTKEDEMKKVNEMRLLNFTNSVLLLISL